MSQEIIYGKLWQHSMYIFVRINKRRKYDSENDVPNPVSDTATY